MKISKIEIKNFKGLKDVYLEPGKFTCLVGENNAGKSSVLQAINLALKLTAEIPGQLFYNSDEPISFRIFLSNVSDEELSRLTDEQKSKISAYVIDKNICFLLTYSVGQKVSVKIPTLVPKDKRYNKDFIDSMVKGKAAEYNQAIKENYPEWQSELPAFKNQGEAKQYIEEKVRNLGVDMFEEGFAELPTGMASSIKSLLPEPIYIPAVKSLSDDLKVAQSTSFGRLIALLLDDMEPDLTNINESLQKLKALLNRIPTEAGETDSRHPKVKNLEKKVEDHLKQQFPNVKIELDIPPPELKTILNSARIFINDGSKDLVDNKGDGIKRSLTFSLLRVYVDHLEEIRQQEAGNKNSTPNPLFFLFEEPELYLHPKSQQILFSALETISLQHSVAVTTHSPIFFHPGATASFIRVRKEDATPKPIGKLHHINFHLDPTKSESFLLAKYEKSEPAFFCSKVVLFEGDSDEFFLRHISKTLNPAWDFDKMNVGLVKVDGKGNFKKFREFFEAFGVDVFIISDLDSIVQSFDKLGSEVRLNKIRDELLQKVDKKTSQIHSVQIRSKKIKEQVRKFSWQDRYAKAKDSLQKCIATNSFDNELATSLEDLFKIEDDDIRYKILKDDPEVRKEAVPLLDMMREKGICVLSKGSIEDYYPPDVSSQDSKPKRALLAIQKITNKEHVLALSQSLHEGRKTELEEIFDRIF